MLTFMYIVFIYKFFFKLIDNIESQNDAKQVAAKSIDKKVVPPALFEVVENIS